MITICMNLARAEHLRRLRAARAALLAQLDADINRAVDAGGERAAKPLRARRQQLRDATADPAIAAAETPEALIASIADEDLRARYAALLG